MSKCIIDSNAIDIIRSESYNLVEDYYNNENSTPDSLALSIKEYINSLKDQYVISKVADIKAVTQTIYEGIHEEGGLDEDEMLFNEQSYRTWVEVVSKGGTLNLGTVANPMTEEDATALDFITSSDFLTNAYGDAYDVQRRAEIQATANLVDALFINRGSIEGIGQGAVSSSEINRNIRIYLQQLLNKICEYLKTKEQFIPTDIMELINNPVLYNEENKNTGIILKIQPYIEKYLGVNRFNSQMLRGLQASVNENDKLKLEAYNANVFFTNFDQYISDVFPNAIHIKSTERGIKTGSDDKYRLGDKSTGQANTTHRKTDEISENELDAVTRKYIETSPIYLFNGEQKTNEYLNFGFYQNILGKIKELGIKSEFREIVLNKDGSFELDYEELYYSLSEQTREFLSLEINGHPISIAEAINIIRKNPRQYTHSIFELLSNKEFYKLFPLLYNDFSEKEMDHLYSSYRALYDPENGLRGLVNVNSEIDYYHYITQTSDSVYKNNFIQYTRDELNNLILRKAIDQVRIRKRRQLVNSINSIAYNNLKNTHDLYNLKEDQFTNRNSTDILYKYNFTIPNTNLQITVSLDQEGKESNITYPNNIDFNELLTNNDVLQFIDDVLGTDILNNSDFILTMDSKSPTLALRKLTWLASNVLVNSYVYNNIISDLNNLTDEEKTLSKKALIESKLKQKYNNRDFEFLKRGIRNFNVISKSDFAETVLQLIISTQMNLEGLTTSTQVKNSQGNAQSNLSLSKLLGSYLTQWDLQERNENSATKKLSILNTPGLFELGHYSTTEYYDNRDQNLKNATKFMVSEQAYAAIMANYIPALMPTTLTNSTVGNGIATFYASVDSDKNTISLLPFNLSTSIDVNGELVRIMNMSDALLKWAMCKDFGEMNLRILYNIANDFEILTNFARQQDPTFPEINPANFTEFNTWCQNRTDSNRKKLNPFDVLYNLTSVYNKQHRLHPINIVEDMHYRRDGKTTIIPNILLLSQIARFAPNAAVQLGINLDEYYSYDEFFKYKEREIVYSLVKSNTKFDLFTKENDTNNSVKKFIKETLPDWVDDSEKMIIAKVSINGNNYNIGKKYDVNIIALKEKIKPNQVYDFITEINPYLKRYNRLEYWFTQQWMATTVGTYIDHPGKKVNKNGKELFKLRTNLRERLTQIDSQIVALQELAKLDPSKQNEIALLETEKTSIIKSQISKLNKEISLLWEAAAFLDLHKRNVQYTALMNLFAINTLNGIPEHYNIAPVKSISTYETILTQIKNEVSPNDGATFVHGMVNHLENNSLGGNRAGVDKKLFVHFKYERLGISGIDKTAGFAVTNDRIRKSPYGWGNINYQMMNHRWRGELNDESEFIIHPNDVDILTNFRGESINYKDLYFAKNGQLYLIKDIIRRELTPEELLLRQSYLEENPDLIGKPVIGYERIIYKVDYEGNELEQVSAAELEANGIESISILGTNHDVWRFFGGEYSLAKNHNGKLRPSESSFENLTLASNNIGFIKINPNTGSEYTLDRIESQEQLFQFMKYSDIHYMPDSGSMKHGIANVNPSEKYLTREFLNFLQINNYQIGILLDKEHHADDSEVSLPTLIVSACGALGYTIDAATQLYEALASASDLGIKQLYDAAEIAYNNDDITKLREEVFKIVAKELASGKDTNNFAAIIAKSIVERVLNDPKNEKYGQGLNQLPLSDRTVMAKMISTISSFINKSSIKIKLPGILAVISPVHDLYKIYGDRTYDSFTNPEEEIRALQESYRNNPIFDSEIVSIQQTPDWNNIHNWIFNESKDSTKLFGVQVDKQLKQNYLEWSNNNPNGIVAYRVNYNYYNTPEEALAGRIGNPFSETGKGPETVELFFRWIVTGENFGNVKATEEFRLAIINKILNTPENSPILYYTELNRPSHATVLGYLINNKQFLTPTKTVNPIKNLIYDIKLGRYYKLELTNGNELDLFIDTPKKLRLLKKYINQGLITKVYENIEPGRNLGAYNVIFEGVDEQGNKVKHLLWELDNILLIQEFNDETSNDNDFKEWYQNKFGTTTNMTRYQYGRILNRRIQQDLYNLSKVGDDKVAKFNELCDALTNSKSTEESNYNRNILNRWVYGELGQEKASQLLALLQNVPDATYNQQLYNLVYPLIAEKQYVYIDGKPIIPNKKTIKVDAYELIMPKIFLELFGFEEFTDLNKVRLDKDYFIKQYIQNRNLVNGTNPKPNENLFDIELLNSNGNHIFIITSDHLQGSNLVKTDKEILIKEINGKLIRVDFDGNEMYEIPEGTQIYQDSNGNEVLVFPNNLDAIDDAIATMSFDIINFSLNLKNYGDFALQLALKLSENDKKSVREFFEESILVGNNLDSNKILSNFKEVYVPELTVDNYNQPEILNKIKDIVKSQRRKYASFLKSLEIVAGRIPSQCLLSFMPMKVVAYENPNRNSAYVSNLLLLLLGSDLDIDSVTLVSYDINDSGFIELWSPYANIELYEGEKNESGEIINAENVDPLGLINASLELPFPTGENIEYKETENVEEVIEMLKYFRNAINWNRNRLYFRTNAPRHLSQIKKVLSFKNFVKPTKEKMVEFVQKAEELIGWSNIHSIDKANLVFNNIQQMVNKHNNYFKRKPNYFIKRTLNNYITSAMYTVSSDPVNQLLAQAPVDAITDPLKKIADDSDSAKDVYTRTPGTFMGKLESMEDNSQGKDCVGISAVGIKAYFALTQYFNTVLNNGTAEELQRLLGNLKFSLLQGRVKDSKTILANIRAKDPSTVTNDEVLELLLSVKNDEDLALTLSALLSLAVDNAKELSLANLNAGSTMIGTYIYGICIGFDFKDIAKILMSPTAKVLKEVMDSNIMTDDIGYNKLIDTFKYFEKIPWTHLLRFDKHIADWSKIEDARKKGLIKNYDTPFKAFANFIKEVPFNINIYTKGGNVNLAKFALNSQALELLEQFKLTEKRNFIDEDQVLFNLMIDFLEEYIVLYKSINLKTLDLFKKLVHGALEMYVIGQVVGLNQGLSTDLPGMITKTGYIEDALFDAYDNRIFKHQDDKFILLEETPDSFLSEMLNNKEFRKQKIAEYNSRRSPLLMKIDLKRFAKDPNYRELCIDLYEPLKMSFNILDVIDKCPHILKYVQKLEIANRSNSLSYNYRQIKEVVRDISKIYKIPPYKAVRAIDKYIGDLNILDWQLSQGPFIKLPKGTRTFAPTGVMNPEPAGGRFDLQLGSDYTNATFRYWMENSFIPDLKKGKIIPNLKNNLFVKGLTNDIRTNVTSGNGPIVYTVKANLLPRTAQELNIFDQYADSFALLDGLFYEKHGNKIPIQDLFILYALIAHDGLLAENSLMSLFKSTKLLTEGLLGSLHDFITKRDAEKDVENLYQFLKTSEEINIEDPDPRVLLNLLFTRYAVGGNFSLFNYSFDELFNLNVLTRKTIKGEKADRGLKNRKFILHDNEIDINQFPDAQVNENTIFIPNNRLDYILNEERNWVRYDLRIDKMNKTLEIITNLGVKKYEGIVTLLDNSYEFLVDPREIIFEELNKDNNCKLI